MIVFPTAPFQKPRRSPLRLRFWLITLVICALEKSFCVIYGTYLRNAVLERGGKIWIFKGT